MYMALAHDDQWSSSSSSSGACLSCGPGSVSGRAWRRRRKATGIIMAFCYLVRLMGRALSTVLTILFAIGGAFAGGIAGAMAGWISNGGILHGIALVAIAGASISVEFLDILRTFWCSGCPASYSPSSMANFLQELVHDRFVNGQIERIPTATSWIRDLQVNRPNTSYGESRAGHSEVASSGLSVDSLKKLPSLILLDEMKAAQEACCTICLQDISIGDTARRLPQCLHIFHLACVDKWLVIHNSCPVCRRDV